MLNRLEKRPGLLLAISVFLTALNPVLVYIVVSQNC